MGVDAQMIVAAPQELDDDALRRLSYETVAAFGTQVLWVAREDRYGSGTHHALTRGTRYYEIEEPPGTKTTFTVRLWGRYYGENYERGDLPTILSLARWFRSKLPGCTVFYGGDTYDLLSPLTVAREDQLWAHFCEVQHLPYIDHGSIMDDGIEKPWCEFCQERTVRNGWGQDFAACWCPGCGWHVETRDGGRTWSEPKEKV